MDNGDSDDGIISLTPVSSSRGNGPPRFGMDRPPYSNVRVASTNANEELSRRTVPNLTTQNSDNYGPVTAVNVASNHNAGGQSNRKQGRIPRYFDPPPLKIQAENQNGSPPCKRKRLNSYSDEQDFWHDRIPEPRQVNFYNQPRISGPVRPPSLYFPATYETPNQRVYNPRGPEISSPGPASFHTINRMRTPKSDSDGPLFLKNPLYVGRGKPPSPPVSLLAHHKTHKRKCVSPSLLQNVEFQLPGFLDAPEINKNCLPAQQSRPDVTRPADSDDNVVILSRSPSPAAHARPSPPPPDVKENETKKMSQTIIVDLLSDSEEDEEITCLTNDTRNDTANTVRLPTPPTYNNETFSEVLVVDRDPTLRIFYKDGKSVPAPEGFNVDDEDRLDSPKKVVRKKNKFSHRASTSAQARCKVPQVNNQLQFLIDNRDFGEDLDKSEYGNFEN